MSPQDGGHRDNARLGRDLDVIKKGALNEAHFRFPIRRLIGVLRIIRFRNTTVHFTIEDSRLPIKGRRTHALIRGNVQNSYATF